MSPETIQAIQSALAPIADKIGQGAAFGWETVVRQQYIEGITMFVWSGLAFGISALLIGVSMWQAKNVKKASQYDKDGWVVGAAMVGALGLFVLVITFALITSGIQHMLNPNYYALQFFINLVNPPK